MAPLGWRKPGPRKAKRWRRFSSQFAPVPIGWTSGLQKLEPPGPDWVEVDVHLRMTENTAVDLYRMAAKLPTRNGRPNISAAASLVFGRGIEAIQEEAEKY